MILLEQALREQLGIKPEPSNGKRGRPKGTKNGTTSKAKDKWDHIEASNARHKRQYNPATNILNARPRPVVK
jgi:hypothetical protein